MGAAICNPSARADFGDSGAMKKQETPRHGFRNRILARLPLAVLQHLKDHLTEVEAVPRDPIFEPNTPFEHVYFPETGVASLLTVLEDGAEVEVATVGYEGFVGLPAFFGARQSPGRAFWQIPGKGFRMDLATLREETTDGGPLTKMLNLYAQFFFTQVAQSATCNRLHSVEQRCARWMLMSHDRVEGDQFDLTQEFLAQMLGVRRTGVTETAGALQGEGLIRYSRGHMTIVDREGLERKSCECYRAVRAEMERLLG